MGDLPIGHRGRAYRGHVEPSGSAPHRGRGIGRRRAARVGQQRAPLALTLDLAATLAYFTIMGWLFALAGLALVAVGALASSMWRRRSDAAAVIGRTVDTRQAEDSAAAAENAKGAERAGEVLRASSSDLADRVAELRAVGRGEKPPDAGE